MKTQTNRAWIVGDVAYVDVSTPTYPRAIALIDADDLGFVVDGGGRWRADQPRGVKTPYVSRWTGPRPTRTFTLLHRHLFGLSAGDGRMLDHANRNGLDNRRENLRFATPSQNVANRATAGRFRGIRKRPWGRWHAHISVGGRQRFLGAYETAEDAARAYDRAAQDIFGDFACLNFESEAA